MSTDFEQLTWDAQLADDCRRLVRAAVLEDLDRGQDWTTVALVPLDANGTATVVARQDGVIAGLPAAQLVVAEMDPARLKLEPFVDDGTAVTRGTKIARLSGSARSLLTVERPLLNFLGRMSGIATLTSHFVASMAGTKAQVYDTRKTTPGWRRLEKYAVRCGGGRNHRTGLFDAILIKDNHLAFAAEQIGGNQILAGQTYSPAQAVRAAQQFIAENFPIEDPRRGMLVEVEVDSLVQLEQVLPAGPHIVLLDNMGLDDLRRAVELRNRLAPTVQLEASGGVRLETVAAIAATGVERISAGALTHSAVNFDVALDWE